jgi:hypothetical protein
MFFSTAAYISLSYFRRKVASMLAQSIIETKIAEQLNVGQSTKNRDV